VIDPSLRAILELYPHMRGQDAWRLLCEYALEERRLALAGPAVSRMDSNFVFLSEQDAIKQLPKMSGSKHLFEVEFVDSTAPTFAADFDLITRLFTFDNVPFQQKIRNIAGLYWSGVITGTPELLTTSPLRVIRTVRTFP
jgi:hypothetical protein